jgi:four helix bundle protein
MNQIKSFRDLLVWQKAMILVTDTYQSTKTFPSNELFGLTSQMRRSAVSIPSNIAEGYGRNSTGDYKRFLQIAVGSLYELQTHIEISKNLDFINEITHQILLAKAQELDRMLLALIRKIN